MSRVTVKDCHRLCSTANAILLWRGTVDRQTGVGRLQVYAHGVPKRAAIHRVVTPGGGITVLHPTTTAREAYAFLSGFIVSLRIAYPDAPLSADTREGGAL